MTLGLFLILNRWFILWILCSW